MAALTDNLPSMTREWGGGAGGRAGARAGGREQRGSLFASSSGGDTNRLGSGDAQGQGGEAGDAARPKESLRPTELPGTGGGSSGVAGPADGSVFASPPLQTLDAMHGIEPMHGMPSLTPAPSLQPLQTPQPVQAHSFSGHHSLPSQHQQPLQQQPHHHPGQEQHRLQHQQHQHQHQPQQQPHGEQQSTSVHQRANPLHYSHHYQSSPAQGHSQLPELPQSHTSRPQSQQEPTQQPPQANLLPMFPFESLFQPQGLGASGPDMLRTGPSQAHPTSQHVQDQRRTDPPPLSARRFSLKRQSSPRISTAAAAAVSAAAAAPRIGLSNPSPGRTIGESGVSGGIDKHRTGGSEASSGSSGGSAGALASARRAAHRGYTQKSRKKVNARFSELMAVLPTPAARVNPRSKAEILQYSIQQVGVLRSRVSTLEMALALTSDAELVHWVASQTADAASLRDVVQPVLDLFTTGLGWAAAEVWAVSAPPGSRGPGALPSTGAGSGNGGTLTQTWTYIPETAGGSDVEADNAAAAAIAATTGGSVGDSVEGAGVVAAGAAAAARRVREAMRARIAGFLEGGASMMFAAGSNEFISVAHGSGMPLWIGVGSAGGRVGAGAPGAVVSRIGDGVEGIREVMAVPLRMYGAVQVVAAFYGDSDGRRRDLVAGRGYGAVEMVQAAQRIAEVVDRRYSIGGQSVG